MIAKRDKYEELLLDVEELRDELRILREEKENRHRQARRMEAIATLAGGIAHDFNNILGIIMGCADLVLCEMPQESRAREHLKELYGAVERGRGLIQQILTYSDQPAPPVVQKDGSPPRGKGERVLLIDDEEVLAEIISRMLEGLGYEVTVTTSGQEALSLFRAHPESFDLVFTDQTMPRMTGLELGKAIREIRPETPIILCTGYSGLVVEETQVKSCIQTVVNKPILLNDLASTMRKALGD